MTRLLSHTDQSTLRARWHEPPVGLLRPMLGLRSHGVAAFPSSQRCRVGGDLPPTATPHRRNSPSVSFRDLATHRRCRFKLYWRGSTEFQTNPRGVEALARPPRVCSSVSFQTNSHRSKVSVSGYRIGVVETRSDCRMICEIRDWHGGSRRLSDERIGVDRERGTAPEHRYASGAYFGSP